MQQAYKQPWILLAYVQPPTQLALPTQLNIHSLLQRKLDQVQGLAHAGSLSNLCHFLGSEQQAFTTFVFVRRLLVKVLSIHHSWDLS